MRIGIIGLGYVGLTFGIAAADCGIEVFGVEINQHIKDCLKNNKSHFYEPGLDNLIKRHNDKKFFVVDEFPEDLVYDAFIITVGSPLKEGEKQPDFGYIKSSLDAIKKIYDGSQLIVLRSTVSVGTTRNVVLPFLEELSGRPRDEILAGMCPERTIEGKAIEELTNLPQIISGNNEKALDIAQRLFRCITPFVIKADSLEEAELIKLFCNTYRDMTFSIGNVFCMAAQRFGVDGTRAIKHANQGYFRSNIALPGFVAGPCLEKDAYILINNMPECDSREFILAARKFNESLEDIVVEWVKKRIGDAKGSSKTIVLSGMAFKGQPETSDLRGSSSVYIARKLHELGYRLYLHDYVAHRREMENLQIGEVFDNIYDACKNASLLLILNNNKKYSTLQADECLSKSKKGFAILDSWGVCTELYYSSDIDISTLGNMDI